MARTPKQEHNDSADRGGTHVRNVIGKEEPTVIMYHVVIAVVPKHKHLIRKIFFFAEAKQIAKRRI